MPPKINDGLTKYQRYDLKHPDRQKKYRKDNPDKSPAACARWRSRHPDRVTDSFLRSTYGISLESYEVLLESQGGKCAICGTLDPDPYKKGRKRFCVDHDHNTGKVRGILCPNCNLAVYHVKDSPDIASGLVRYLERFA